MRRIVFVSSLLCAMAGCAVQISEDDGSAGAGQAVSTTQQAHHSVSCSLSSYSANGSTVQMASDSSSFCWLTKIQGQLGSYYNGGPAVYRSGGNWYLSAVTSTQWASAYCAPLSCFSGDGTSDVIWISGEFSTSADGISGCVSNTASTWWGDAATVLSGFPGNGTTAGLGEYASVTQSIYATTSSTLRAQDCYSGDFGGCGSCSKIYGRAFSLFVGTPGGSAPAWFYGPGGTNAFYQYAGGYSVTSTSAGVPVSATMAPIDQAICYFARLGGKFAGGGEYAQIVPTWDAGMSKWRWTVTVGHLGASSGIRADVNCYRYHQWTL